MSPPEDIRSRAIALPPKLLEEIIESNEAYERFTRGQLALIQHEMVTKLRGNPDASVSQYAVVHERLSKNAKLEKGAAQGSTGTQVVINFVRAKEERGVTIEGTATALPTE